MKVRKITQKLQLNKETVTNLNDTEQLAIRGGLPNTSYNHPANCYTMCQTGVCCLYP